MAKVYTVVQGELKDIKFKTGISDGKFTEVLGDELKEARLLSSVIAKAPPPKMPKHSQCEACND